MELPRLNRPILIALGANLPVDAREPADNLRLSLASLPAHGLTVERASRLYATPCFPPGAGPDYVNAAARLRAAPGMDARAVLAALHAVEREFGRERKQRWGMRTLDLDLIAMGSLVLPDPRHRGAMAQPAPRRAGRLHPRPPDPAPPPPAGPRFRSGAPGRDRAALAPPRPRPHRRRPA